MPSTYTTNLGIEKIAVGEQSGTWGGTTNTNWDLVDEATNGIISITLASAGSSGSPNSLPVSDGASSNGRNKFIEFTDGGDLGATAYVQLTPNDAEKIVHVRNSLSGSQSLILFQGTYSASNDYELIAGADAYLKFNGAGAGATVTEVFSNLVLTGITSLTNGDITITPNGTGDLVLDGLNWPQADGTASYVLQTDGAGQLSWAANTGGLADVVDDVSPQLGGDLDVNGSSIISASNGDIAITPNGTGDLILDGLKWPQADGTSGYILTTNGSGQLSWTGAGSGTLSNIVEDTTPQLGGNLDVNGNSIVSVSAGDIAITPDTTGNVILDGLNWPQADGSNGNVLSTNGAGQLTWLATSSITTDISITGSVTEEVWSSVSSTVALDPANGTVLRWFKTGALTATDSLSNGEFLLIHLVCNVTSITWPTMVWVGGSAPTLDDSASNNNIIRVWKNNSTLFGHYIGVTS